MISSANLSSMFVSRCITLMSLIVMENNIGANASFNSSCAQPLGLTPGDLPVFLLIDGKLPDAGHLSCQMPGGGDESRGQMTHYT